jgi:hypothetical protein
MIKNVYNFVLIDFREEYRMKRLVLASFLLVTFGTFAHAIPVAGVVLCEEEINGLVCTQIVQCAGLCSAENTTQQDSICS